MNIISLELHRMRNAFAEATRAAQRLRKPRLGFRYMVGFLAGFTYVLSGACTDPQALAWEEDVHCGLTQWLAERAGLSKRMRH
jgi:hypothetical protein